MSEYYEFHCAKSMNNGLAYKYHNSKNIALLNEENKSVILQKFKNIIGASTNVLFKDKSCCSDDNFLNRFLYKSKFQCDNAFNRLISYMDFKHQNELILSNLNIFDTKLKLALMDGNPSVIRQRDRRGRKVLVFTTNNWDPMKYSIEDVFRAFLLTLDKLLENMRNQALGFVIIVDWTNFTFKQSTFLSPKVLKIMIDGLQNRMPIKFKAIHFIAQPWYVDIAFTVMKSFLNEKTKRRITTHGSNLTSLHQLVNRDILPPDLGGEGSAVNTLDWYHFLLESSQVFESPNTYRLISHPIYTRSPLNNVKSQSEIDENVAFRKNT